MCFWVAVAAAAGDVFVVVVGVLLMWCHRCFCCFVAVVAIFVVVAAVVSVHWATHQEQQSI